MILQVYFDSPDAELRSKWFDEKIIEAAISGTRYHLYPLIAAARPGGAENHWTLLVHDTHSMTWKHYNSMRPRDGVEDNHFNKGKKVVITSHNQNIFHT